MFWMYTMHPNVLRLCTVGFFPCHISNRVMASTLFVRHLFSTYTTILTASPQNHLRRPLALSKLLVVATTMPFRCSMTSFWCGLQGGVC
jgi:hypothetical protein